MMRKTVANSAITWVDLESGKTTLKGVVVQTSSTSKTKKGYFAEYIDADNPNPSLNISQIFCGVDNMPENLVRAMEDSRIEVLYSPEDVEKLEVLSDSYILQVNEYDNGVIMCDLVDKDKLDELVSRIYNK